MSRAPCTSATQRPLRTRLWRRRVFQVYLIFGSFLFSLIAVALIGGTRLSQHERQAVEAIEALKHHRPQWCVDLAVAQATAVRTLPDPDIPTFPDGPTWWLANSGNRSSAA